MIPLDLPRFHAREDGTVDPADLDHFVRTLDLWADEAVRKINELETRVTALEP